MVAETNFIHRIGIHASAETALPSLPSKGSNMSSTTGFVIIGTIQDGDDADLDGGDVVATFFDESGEVHPPRSLTREDIVNFRNGIESVAFTAYDGSEALLALASNLSAAANITEAVATNTRRTMFVEVNGRWSDYYPDCDVRMITSGGGYTGDPVTTEIMVRPVATASIKGGWQRHHYQ